MLNAEKYKKEILENLGTDSLISFNKCKNEKMKNLNQSKKYSITAR